MNFDNSFAKRWSVSLLTCKNCNQWFTLMKRWLIDKDLWFVIGFINVSSANTSNSASSFSAGFENQKANSKTLYWLIICTSADDQEHTADHSSVKKVWNALQFKYKKKLQTTGRQYLAEFISYKMLVNTFINEAWTHLSKLDRKIAVTQSDINSLSKSEWCFQVLLQALSEEYTIICDVIDVQDNFNIEWDLQKLQEKETQLKTVETALWVRSQRKDKQRIQHVEQWDMWYYWWSSDSDSDHFTHHKPSRCYLCGGSHRMHDCEYLPAARKQAESKRLTKSTVGISHAQHGKSKRSSEKTHHRQERRKHWAYDAEANKKSNSQLSESSSENKNESDEKIAALSKKIISKISRSYWVADFDVFLHMTDQLQLFRDSLMWICWVTIKVEERRLYADYCDTVTMQDQTGNSILLYYILYVSKLEVNLLSEKWMCEKGLQGSFDHHELYMHDKDDKLVIETSGKGSVYVVKHITKSLHEFALSAMCQQYEHETVCSSWVSKLTGPDLSV